ncbi:spore germination protein [Paenibacillus sp. GSMTC-2017]|uniref:spore germination protein n=1 Tax=Paenibacillus sp. GSMTC-2017 TaxID=2794350 RepID=UPI0018DA0065|nr:spore germination protein [Paenibacillus sp. GSMTC-2017]MBH5319752.1 spore germination protein [Paenibacillus sp. GSMTC-2017]
MRIKSTEKNSSSAHRSNIKENGDTVPLFANLDENIGKIKRDLGNSTDIVFRVIGVGQDGNQAIAIIYTDGLADKKIIDEFIMGALLKDLRMSDTEETHFPTDNVITILEKYALTTGEILELSDFKKLFHALLSGETIILVDGYNKGISASTQGWKDRGVTEPSAESVIRGPREAFSESIRTNTALVRRKIKDPNLWMETKHIGRVTQTDVAIMYIKGIVSDEIVEEVRIRLNRIDIDAILESGYIEELIEDEAYTPFPTVYNSERPDVIAAELLEGKVAIFVDGTPFVLVVPALFVSFMHSAEDYYHRADVSTLIRLLRYLGVFIALFGPSLYVAITTYHQEMLPTQLLISLVAQREGIPFPAFIEALMMEVAFEILREAGLRMPRTIGPAVSIVGTLVIGQAAVEAGIVSAAMVIVVSTTAIASFVFPSYNLANTIRMLRFPLMGLAASFGIFGIAVGVIALVLHLCSLRTFGVPYMSPFAPLVLSDQKDAIFRLPQWLMTTRPRLMSQKNITRDSSPSSKKPNAR